jgi:hypothetical protein
MEVQTCSRSDEFDTTFYAASGVSNGGPDRLWSCYKFLSVRLQRRWGRRSRVLEVHETRAGSWKAGVDGAQPGILINADPQVTDSNRQEFYKGVAEDMYWVVATGESKSVPFGDFDDVVRILEWSPLDLRSWQQSSMLQALAFSPRTICRAPET